ncbi:hypothetical protein EDEG_02746 [Edhazardia aedis USNM 41457]|uniref:Uncharacterized protein n=1 Tax=Edhazardia aedis (strain USNM 41457) TaxID=1003232 RepID=J9D4W8_EDHAE|nr:hypothetical protein EDEG_02746 [Edhazardia aedis USNM 41457]|eukprot:EJW02866.1 hypothetical protein EDEG_02746 [Edhazardia aedis USNM 41457]
MILIFLLYFVRKFCNAEVEQENWHGIFCYNIDHDCIRMLCFKKTNYFINLVSAIIFDKEIQNRKSSIQGLEYEFSKKLTESVYKKILYYHAIIILYNYKDFVFSDSNHPLDDSTTKYYDIFLCEAFVVRNDLSCFKNIELKKTMANITYEKLANDFDSNETLKSLFTFDLVQALEILQRLDRKNFCGEGIFAKIFIDEIRSYFIDYNYKNISRSIGETLSIFFQNFSLYTNSNALSAFIQDSIVKYSENSSKQSKIPQIFFKCCTDLLIAEILTYPREEDNKINNKETKSIIQKKMEANMKMFLDGTLKMNNNIWSILNQSDFTEYITKTAICKISEIFFGENWYETSKCKDNIKPKIQIKKNKLKKVIENFDRIRRKNGSIYRKLFQRVKKHFKKLSKYGFCSPKPDCNEIIYSYITSRIQNKNFIIIYFEFFNIDTKNDKKSLFLKQIELIQKKKCKGVSEIEIRNIIQKYKKEKLLAISSTIMNNIKLAIKNIFPQCTIVEIKKNDIPSFQLRCFEN